MEVRLHPLISLRSGLNQGRPALGAEMRWRDLALSYLYEDNPLEPVHRIGVSMKFGGTVKERRLAALRAEEEALRSRLAEAFEERQNQRIEDLMGQAERAQVEERYDDALNFLTVALTLSPGLAEAREREAECWRLKGAELEAAGEFAGAVLAFSRALEAEPEDTLAARGLERCRQEGDERARRSAELRARFARALDAFGAGDLGAAREGFAAMLTTDPSDREAAAMLQRTERALRARVTEILEESGRFARAGLLVEAHEAIARAREIDPEAPGITEAEAVLARKQRDLEWDDKTEPTGPHAGGGPVRETAMPGEIETRARQLSPQERRRVEDLYRRGVASMDAQRPQDALRYWELAYSTDPNHAQVKEYLKREYLTRGMDAFANGQLTEAVSNWEKALRVDPVDEKARGYLDRAHQQLSRTREILGSD
jgi:tetratricopeptide (TPR) repeat protein